MWRIILRTRKSLPIVRCRTAQCARHARRALSSRVSPPWADERGICSFCFFGCPTHDLYVWDLPSRLAKNASFSSRAAIRSSLNLFLVIERLVVDGRTLSRSGIEETNSRKRRRLPRAIASRFQCEISPDSIVGQNSGCSPRDWRVPRHSLIRSKLSRGRRARQRKTFAAKTSIIAKTAN
jgi:hypothetical protein